MTVQVRNTNLPGGLLMWTGPSSVPTGQETRANAYAWSTGTEFGARPMESITADHGAATGAGAASRMTDEPRANLGRIHVPGNATLADWETSESRARRQRRPRSWLGRVARNLALLFQLLREGRGQGRRDV